MASINHYPARTQEQVFNCSVEANVHGREPGFPYLAVLTYDFVDTNNYSRLITYFQSAYPFYVKWAYWGGSSEYPPDPSLYAFARGEDSIRANINWLHHDDAPGGSTVLSDAYLRNCIVSMSDDFQNSSSFGGYGIESRRENNEDVLVLPSRYTLIDEGEHLGVPRRYAFESNCIVLNKDSTISASEEVSPSGYIGRHCTIVNQVNSTSTGYGAAYSNGYYGDYRVIYGEAFADIYEWFNWCKTH